MPNEVCVVWFGRRTDGHTLLISTFWLTRRGPARSAVRHREVRLDSLGASQHFRIRYAYWSSIEKGKRIFHALLVELHPCFTDAVTEMGRQYLVGRNPQRMVRGQRLAVINIERGDDAARSHGLDQRRLVHDGSARSVDQDRSRLHERKIGGADQPARTGR